MTLRILIADDEPAARFGMAKALSREGHEIIESADGLEALEKIRAFRPHLVFLDLSMPGKDGKTLLRELQAAEAGPEVIVVTANDAVRSAVECMRLGAADYIIKPFEVDQLRAIARRTARRVELEEEVERLRGELDGKKAFGALVGASAAMQDVYRRLELAARAPVNILICGETGTGKELIAREIHRRSDRARGPFVAVNAAAIPEALAESALFGHVKGAFTGAGADRRGFFQEAHGGTLFLDEIGDMPLPVQAKILRTIEERSIQPVGSPQGIPVDLRVVSATHQDLPRAVAEGRFRQDLYYRVKGIELAVPPLRARRVDIILLAEYFLERFAAQAGGGLKRLAPDAAERLLASSWPGNVRELENAVTGAAAMAPRDEIRAADLPAGAGGGPPDALDLEGLAGLSLAEAKERLVESFEKKAILAALEEHGANISAAARKLGLHRQSLQQKMDQLGILRRP